MTVPTDHDQHANDGLLAQAVVDPAVLEVERAAHRARRRRQRFVALALALATFVAVAAIAAQVGLSDTAPAQGAGPRVAVTAESVGVLLLRPGREPERLASATPLVGVQAREQAAHASYVLDQIATVETTATDARVAVGARASSATASVARIELLGGRVQLTNATITARASISDGRAAGGIELGEGSALLVDGAPRKLSVNQRIAIEGVGTVIINEQAVLSNAPSGDEQTGPRYRTVGAIAHLRVTQDAFGLPAGSELVIGRVDAGVREGKIREVEHPEPGVVVPPVAPTSGVPATLQPGAPKPGDATIPVRPVAVRAGSPGATAGAGLGSYLFPILGTSSFVDTWGAPRASTGIPHQGTDIFAEEGTPIVAIADGVLDRVGWNAIGGYRYWLFDDAGNSFYHAHLSAFSPIARDGARVRRGDVIGFVGHTGDAQFTPPHLHFEVHPGNAGPTNPYQFLLGWKQGVAVAIGLLTGGGAERIAPLALLGFTDISANSGLQDSVLDSVPDTRARSIEQENEPRPTDESLKGAIDGPGTTAERRR